jgi:anti-sigma-K factor RskA
MFWRKKQPKPTRVKRTRIDTLADEPALGMLNIHTDQGPVRLIIDERSAEQLMEECLKLLGFPASMG